CRRSMTGSPNRRYGRTSARSPARPPRACGRRATPCGCRTPARWDTWCAGGSPACTRSRRSTRCSATIRSRCSAKGRSGRCRGCVAASGPSRATTRSCAATPTSAPGTSPEPCASSSPTGPSTSATAPPSCTARSASSRSTSGRPSGCERCGASWARSRTPSRWSRCRSPWRAPSATSSAPRPAT
ncbi:MAG: diguanylate cyclase/phosphodiesterase (GGDEF & EAL domains) with PAS/PAC sensor(s), partial [uncultured Solirubrobacteraceae bacterium]